MKSFKNRFLILGYLKIVCQAHPLQLQAFALSISKIGSDVSRPKLQFVGSCRNDADEARLQNLKDLAVELKVEDDVEFHKNVSYRFVSLYFIYI